MRSVGNVLGLFVLIVLGDDIVHGEPQPMARPTRPEVFSTPDELRKYVDHLSDYILLSGKARYGKRGNALDVGHAWSTMNRIHDDSRLARTRFGKREREESRYFFDPENYNGKQDASRIDDRPCIC